MKIEAASLTLTEIRHGFFTRAGGVSRGPYASLNGGVGSQDDAGKVVENRARMAAALGVEPQRLLTAYQTHSPNVVVAEVPWTTQNRPQADAIVTRILLAEPRAGVIGAAHAGWRGALTGVIEATVAAMERLGAARRQIRAAIGPMIRQSSYEVGPDLIARFQSEDPAASRFFAPASRPGHAMFDLAGYIGTRLKRAGIGEVEDLGLCTYADAEQFFSYRRTTHRAEADYGRHVNAIALTAE